MQLNRPVVAKHSGANTAYLVEVLLGPQQSVFLRRMSYLSRSSLTTCLIGFDGLHTQVSNCVVYHWTAYTGAYSSEAGSAPYAKSITAMRIAL
jgi:hypothetical protein